MLMPKGLKTGTPGKIDIDIDHQKPVQTLGPVGMPVPGRHESHPRTADHTATAFDFKFQKAEIGNDDLVKITVAVGCNIRVVLSMTDLHDPVYSETRL